MFYRVLTLYPISGQQSDEYLSLYRNKAIYNKLSFADGQGQCKKKVNKVITPKSRASALLEKSGKQTDEQTKIF